MKTITFTMPEMGEATGTLKWASNELEKIVKTFQLSKTKDNRPCITYQSQTDKNDKGEYKRYIICTTGEKYGFDLINSNSVLYSIDGEYHNGLFQYLTPSAKKYVDELLSNILDEFITELEKN